MNLPLVARLASIVLSALLATMAHAFAARDELPPPASGHGDELVVFETQSCIYCDLFRRDVLPDYLRSQRGRNLPIKFVDAERATQRRAQLRAPLTHVPTFVLIRRGREVGRISGYTGPGLFFPLINALVKNAD